jgi:hypothetical protein
MWCEIEFKFVVGRQKYSISICDEKERQMCSKGLLHEIVSYNYHWKVNLSNLKLNPLNQVQCIIVIRIY